MSVVEVPFDILDSEGDKQWDGLVTEPITTTTSGDVAILLLHGTAGDMHGGHMAREYPDTTSRGA